MLRIAFNRMVATLLIVMLLAMIYNIAVLVTSPERPKRCPIMDSPWKCDTPKKKPVKPLPKGKKPPGFPV